MSPSHPSVAAVRRQPRFRAVLAGLIAAVPLALGTVQPVRAEPTRAEVADQVEVAVGPYLEEYNVPGAAVAVTRGSEVLYAGGLGTDSLGQPVTADTRMRIASLSKSFSAMAVLQLVDQGRLDLDDPVVDHLPEFQMADPRAARITVRQLLNHSSGLADPSLPDEYAPGPTTLPESVQRLRGATLATDPGTAWAYANPNYHVAARLVEVVSKHDFGDYLDRRIFEPAGMTSSLSTRTSAADVGGLADGHIYAYGQPVAVSGPNYFTAGAGGVVTTARDMSRWLIVQTNQGRAIDGSRVVSADAVTEMHTAQEPDPDGTYALGWYHTPAERGRPEYVSHSGGAGTYSGYQILYPRTGPDYGIVLLLNTGASLTGPTPTDPAQDLAALLGLDRPAPAEPSRALLVDLVTTGLAAGAVVLAVLGVRRADRWALRLLHRPWSAALRTVPYLAVIGGVLAVPRLQLMLLQRDAPWPILFSVAPVPVVALILVAAACAATVLARAVRWSFLRHRQRRS